MPRFGNLRNLVRRPTSGFLIVLSASAGGGYFYRKYISSLVRDDQKLNPYSFTPYTLISKETVSSSNSIFTLRPKQCGETSSQVIQDIWRKGVWSVEAKQPQLQIARSYTPLPSTDDSRSEDELRILIRREEGGEVSTYLHNLPEEATVDLRGPHLEFNIPDSVTEVLFLAGGTGIAPALQVANLLAQRGGSKMHILWANRKREECIGGRNDRGALSTTRQQPNSWRSLFGLGGPGAEHNVADLLVPKGRIVQELDRLKGVDDTSHFDITYFVDEENNYIKPSDVLRNFKNSANSETTNKLVLVSGPDGFVEFWAGKKVWAGGQEVQGPLGGVLGRLELQGWKVWKL
jgi:hypothetical protein